MVSIKINSDDKDVSRTLEAAKKKLIDMSPEMREIGQYMASQTQLRFNTMTAPNGRKWKPLKPSYLKWKKRHYPETAEKILQMTKALRRSLSFGYGISYGKLSVTVASSVPYFITHQLGLKVKIFGKYYYTFPKREMVGVNKKDIKNIENVIKGVW